MKKKSKILALICALCLAFGSLFVACGGGNNDDFDNSKSSSKKEQQSGKESGDDWTGNY